jgi:hypothetical protein
MGRDHRNGGHYRCDSLVIHLLAVRPPCQLVRRLSHGTGMTMSTQDCTTRRAVFDSSTDHALPGCIEEHHSQNSGAQ